MEACSICKTAISFITNVVHKLIRQMYYHCILDLISKPEGRPPKIELDKPRGSTAIPDISYDQIYELLFFFIFQIRL